jgi:hypothetical protein
MPLDPSIPLAAVRGVNTPFENLDVMLQLQTQQQKQAEIQRKREQQQRLEQTIAKHQGNWETALPELRAIDPDLSLDIEEALGKARKERADAVKAELESEKSLTEKWLGRLRGLPKGDEELYQTYRQMVGQDLPDLAGLLPDAYDETRLSQIMTTGETTKDYLGRQQDAIGKALEGKFREAAAGALSTATDAEEWQERIDGLRELGVPSQELAIFGAWSEEAPARALQLGITPKEQAALTGQAEGREIQREGQAITVRGQQLSAETARRGQDMAAATSRRGQDLSASQAAARLAQDKASAAAGGAGGAKLSAGAIEKIAGADTALGSLSKIEELLPNYAKTLGPVAGRFAQTRQNFPGASEGFAEFAAEVATLKNAVVKATTGAAMSEPEAKRIMTQVPDLTNQPEVFRARLVATRRNLDTLKRRTIELSGGTVEPDPAAPAGVQQRPIPGVPGGVAELRNGRWIRVK